ncbi:unnamed protein product [Heligmosomoides polygyrus]|uniref:EF-hand domain-containing protein n=1 Tax=Heligmosomoides polygyrus TaxID=6339 RepID=A0A3P7ZHX3_HELPZ|nr:unnamed protein product [Heligmosomoides polygyrus]
MLLLAPISMIPLINLMAIADCTGDCSYKFRRLDTDGDEQITFTEFILGDHHYIERQSAAFHKLDDDGDGVVSRGEYDAYYKKIDDDHRHNDMDRDRFFEGLVGFRSPAVEFLRFIDFPSNNDLHSKSVGLGNVFHVIDIT